MWEIVDRQIGYRVGKPYKHFGRALARADKLDNAYGAYRYEVRRVGAATKPEDCAVSADKIGCGPVWLGTLAK